MHRTHNAIPEGRRWFKPNWMQRYPGRKNPTKDIFFDTTNPCHNNDTVCTLLQLSYGTYNPAR